VYRNEDARLEELADLGGTIPDSMEEFYRRYKKISSAHRKNPGLVAETMEMEFVQDEMAKRGYYEELLEPKFSGEEGFGKYLDLNQHYDRYLNLKGVLDQKMSYMSYLADFDKFELIPRETRSRSDYVNYLQDLCNYLEHWMQRAKPLINIAHIREEALNGKIQEEANLFCKACQKEFAKQTVYDAHLMGKKHIKAMEQMEHQNGEVKHRSVAQLECLIKVYGQLLKEQREETHMHVERKQALTDLERVESEEEFEEPEDEEEAEEDGKIFNPLKLPIGWDGKPIPFWLYKLHGLSVEYPCEICGNFVYQGRKAFDLHFQEWRHANGMRSLGIPNSKHFHDVTKIDDALALWDKMKQKTRSDVPLPEVIEEIEDADGNVYNKKTYVKSVYSNPQIVMKI
jgi:splicing factor 3A subunit 3